MKECKHKKPVAKFRAGQVSCALWENEIRVDGRPQKIVKASVERRYKDRDGTWKSSNNYSRNEIPLAIFVLFQAFESMVNKGDDQDTSEVVEEQRVA